MLRVWWPSLQEEQKNRLGLSRSARSSSCPASPAAAGLVRSRGVWSTFRKGERQLLLLPKDPGALRSRSGALLAPGQRLQDPSLPLRGCSRRLSSPGSGHRGSPCPRGEKGETARKPSSRCTGSCPSSTLTRRTSRRSRAKEPTARPPSPSSSSPSCVSPCPFSTSSRRFGCCSEAEARSSSPSPSPAPSYVSPCPFSTPIRCIGWCSGGQEVSAPSPS